MADRADAGGRRVRRRPLHAAGGQTGRPQGLADRAAGRSAAGTLAGAGILSPATASDLTRGCTLLRQPSGWPRPAPRPARNWSRSRATRSIRSGPSARRRRSARSRFTARNFPARSKPRSSSASGSRSHKLGVDALVLSDSHAVAWTFNIRGADVSHTPLPLSYALVPKDGRPTVFIDHRKLSNSARDHLERSADVEEPDALTPKLTELAQARRIDRARQRHRRRRAEPPDRGRRRQAGARQRSRQPAQGGEEPHRDRRHPHRASARRGGAGALPRLDRPRSALGRADRDRHRRGAGDLPPRDRRAEGRLVPDHRRHRAERRHRALPRHPQEQPADCARRSAADRFRRAI